MSKIGIMGGTFDPIHNGHLALAEKAALQFGLDSVLFVTGGNPPHKKGRRMLDAQMRHKMVCIAIKNYKKFEACDYELKKETYSYTFETLQYIKNQHKGDELYFIIGADSLHNLDTWYKPRTICELCTFLVYEREGYDARADFDEIKKKYYCRAEFIDSPVIDISSTQIRKLLFKKKDASGLLPRKVLGFIIRNNFYAPDFGTFNEKIKARLKPERYQHSLNVAQKAVELAKIYGADEKKAYLAGLLHDCAKNIPHERAILKCKDYDVELDEDEIKNPGLIHAKLGEKVARIELGVYDAEILEAIKWHTLGCPGMGELAKIIYVADLIEDGRSFAGIEQLREFAEDNLDDAVEACTRATLNFNRDHNREVHPMAFEVLKWLEEKKNKNEE